MKLPVYVSPMPGVLNKFYPKAFTTFLTGKIYLNSKIFEDLQTENPDPLNISYLVHEEGHRKRVGLIPALRYQLFPKVRLNEELNAYKAQFKYLKSKGIRSYHIDIVAKNLSGLSYFYSTNYENAKNLLEKAWQDA